MNLNKKPVYKYPDFIKEITIKKENGKRYWLNLKILNNKTEKLIVILKNPSRATTEISDKTVYNVSNYIYKNLNKHPELENIGSIVILNLIPIYQTYSSQLKEEKDKIFDNQNFKTINECTKNNKKVIIAWGNHPSGLKNEYNELKYEVLSTLLKNKNEIFYVDKLSKLGNPKHGQIWSYKDQLKNYLKINNISIQNQLWIQFSPHLISFRYKGLPKLLHYTIAFNENSRDINLHLSKNIIDARKPRIELLRISKKDLEKVAPTISQLFLQLIFKKINSNEIDLINSEIITFDNLEKSNSFFLSKLIESLRSISKIKQGKRLKIKGNLETKLTELSLDKEIQAKLLSQYIEMKEISNDKITGGFLIKDNGEPLFLIKIFTEWYELNFNLKPNEILEHFIGKNNSEYFFKHKDNSIKVLKEIKMLEECKKWNKPLTLKLKK